MKATVSTLIYGMWFCLSILLSGTSLAATSDSIAFLNKVDAATVLTQEDDFVGGISQFDMASRMKRADSPSKAEYLAFVASQTLDWSE